MTLRKPASVLFATLLVSASFATVASAATHHSRAAAHRSARAHSDTAGNAATDALNEQSLNSARSGTAPAVAAPA